MNFSTGQLRGYLGRFFQKFLFWALYGIPKDLHRIKPAYLELFGLTNGKGGWGNLGGRFFLELGAVFDPGFTSINSGSSPSDPEKKCPLQLKIITYKPEKCPLTS